MAAEPRNQNEAVLGAAEIAAIAHLYRGEMYRSKIWRTRLDATTNWAVVAVGIALSVSYSSEHASPLPIVIVGALLCVFLMFEARRYQFFDIWRVRVRVLETSFYGPLLRGEGIRTDNGWNRALADDYTGLYYHISYVEALGRRLRRNFGAIFAVQLMAYLGKLVIHPTPLTSMDEFLDRAAVGPFSGEVVLTCCVAFYFSLFAFAVATTFGQKAAGRAHPAREHARHMLSLTATEKF